jgi:N6-adenosine-specific RNA methylase IME4
MELDAICALPVQNITTPDSILFLWATSPKLEEAFRVLNAWGYTYRTCMVWDKLTIGMGYYARQQHELLLICTKGSIPTPTPANRPPSVYQEKKGAHSSKPEYFYTMIESMYEGLEKIEMFCRAPREGWHTWGNQS